MPTFFKKNTENENPEFKNSLLENVEITEQNKNIETEVTPENANHEGEIIDSIEYAKPTKRRFSLGKIISVILILISVVFLSFGGYFAYSLASTSQDSLGQGETQNIFEQAGRLINSTLNPNRRVELKGEKEGRTNFLLIGRDVAAGLTDTMMIASYYHSEKKVVTVNIPRDTQAFDGYETQKINGVFNGGTSREKDKAKKDIAGAESLLGVLSKEFNIPIHYWAIINFDGVKKIVDELGGVEVNVKKDLTDCLYPTDGYTGYIRPCPSFKTGLQRMDGRTALIYSRSRETSSDFDRSERQSIVVQGILAKIKSQNIFENVSKISAYLNILGQNFKTSLKLEEISSLNQILKDFDTQNNFLRIVWSTGNGFLCTGPNPTASYTINYCGGAVIGKTQFSAAREKAKTQIQNLLQEAQSNQLFGAQVVFVGNQSSQTAKARDEFVKAGFNNVDLNNTYKEISAAKKGTTQNVTLYIIEPNLKVLYDGLSKKPNVGGEVKTEFPSTFKLPSNFSDAKIIVWVQ